MTMPGAAQAQDVFSSGSGQRGGNPYGGGNTTGRTGKQAQQDDSVYCQQTPDGRVIPRPYGGTRRNIPCGLPGTVREQPPPPAPEPQKEEPNDVCVCPTRKPDADSGAPLVPSSSSFDRSGPHDINAVSVSPPPGGDTFRSGSTPPKTTVKTRPKSQQSSSSGCTCPSQNDAKNDKLIFNYYYLNGMNTPQDMPDLLTPDGRLLERGANRRGSCNWDRRMIAANLIGNGSAPVPAMSQVKWVFTQNDIRVTPNGNEQDILQDSPCQFSGTDPLWVPRMQKVCSMSRTANNPGWRPETYQLARLLCAGASDLDKQRSGGGKMAPGDLLECFLQSLHIDVGEVVGAPGAAGIAYTDSLPLVKKVVEIIRKQRSLEKAGEKNFFIVIAHSQGNFFAEGVAHTIARQDPALFKDRFGILSFGSPTSYDAIDQTWAKTHLKQFTRQDDAIRALQNVHDLMAQTPFPPPKTPFGDNLLPPLWQWPAEQLAERLIVVKGEWNILKLPEFELMPKLRSPLLESMELGPPDKCRAPCPDCDERSRCDGALYTPFMNSHLLDNYLTHPTLTRDDVPVNDAVYKALGVSSGGGVRSVSPVLATVRLKLAELKRSLAGSAATSGVPVVRK